MIQERETKMTLKMYGILLLGLSRLLKRKTIITLKDAADLLERMQSQFIKRKAHPEGGRSGRIPKGRRKEKDFICMEKIFSPSEMSCLILSQELDPMLFKSVTKRGRTNRELEDVRSNFSKMSVKLNELSPVFENPLIKSTFKEDINQSVRDISDKKNQNISRFDIDELSPFLEINEEGGEPEIFKSKILNNLLSGFSFNVEDKGSEFEPHTPKTNTSTLALLSGYDQGTSLQINPTRKQKSQLDESIRIDRNIIHDWINYRSDITVGLTSKKGEFKIFLEKAMNKIDNIKSISGMEDVVESLKSIDTTKFPTDLEEDDQEEAKRFQSKSNKATTIDTTGRNG